MAKFYAGRITRGKLTIDDVPELWREAVQALLDAVAAKLETINLAVTVD